MLLRTADVLVFPITISIPISDDIGKAVMSTDTDGLFADILRVLLLAVFNLQEEEEDDDSDEQKASDQKTSTFCWLRIYILITMLLHFCGPK